VKVREVLNAIFYVLSTGCQALPKDPPPKSTAHYSGTAHRDALPSKRDPTLAMRLRSPPRHTLLMIDRGASSSDVLCLEKEASARCI
jgi:transposase